MCVCVCVCYASVVSTKLLLASDFNKANSEAGWFIPMVPKEPAIPPSVWKAGLTNSRFATSNYFFELSVSSPGVKNPVTAS